MKDERHKWFAAYQLELQMPYADWDAAQNSGGEFHGASERKEQPDTVREASGAEIQMPK
jgi:hypothetical protein